MGKMNGSSSPTDISTKQRRIAELAKQMPEKPLTTLAHNIDMLWLKEAFRRTRKDAAPGVDGQTWRGYSESLDNHLADLLGRAKSGQYKAPAVRRVRIPKGSGGTRPIGIPTIEDKVLQRAVVMVLEPIYEREFLDCSYGFRPGRSAHQALAVLWQGLMDLNGGWVIELDIQSYFDAVDRNKLQEMLRQRVGDGVLLRLIGKWLNAGVLEEGNVTYTETGTPQGGVVSPLLANIFLHEILDVWFERTVKPRLKGRTMAVRYADDATLVFEREDDARRVMAVLPKRFAKYGLTLHPEKTRLISFRRPFLKSHVDRNSRPGTFDVLGFTHYWAKSRKGNWVIKRKTIKTRLSRAIRSVSDWMREHMHDPIKDQYTSLSAKLRGHYAYYGISGNARALSSFRYWVVMRWRYWLSRRGARPLSWDKMESILKKFHLPEAIPIHSILRNPAKP
jgi:group II intron reverse transcriptase/maturase